MTSPLPPEYPPARHVLRDLRLSVEHRADGTSTAWMPVVPELETESGAMRAGALATLVDVLGGGLAATAAQPDWIATADLTLHMLSRRPKAQVTAHGRVLRHGRTTVVIEVRLQDAAGDALGLATMSFAVLPRRDGNLTVDQSETVRRMTLAAEGSGLVAPLNATVGLRVLDAEAGIIELPLADYVRNSLGALQGGMVATAVDAAAEAALRAAADTEVETVDLQITYLALARVGPVRTRAEVLDTSDATGNGSTGATYGSARIEVFDAGADDRVVAIARTVAGAPA